MIYNRTIADRDFIFSRFGTKHQNRGPPRVREAVPPSGWWWRLLRLLLPHFRFSLFWWCFRSFSMFWNFLHRFKNKKNLNNCFLKDITMLYFPTEIFSLPDDKCLRNCIVSTWLLLRVLFTMLGPLIRLILIIVYTIILVYNLDK